MAPFAGLDPETAVELLRDSEVVDRLPLTMGGPGGPTVQIDRVDGQWCVYTLAVDEAAYSAFCDECQRTGKPLFPEHRMRFLKPHTFLLRCSSREALLERFSTEALVLDSSYRASLRPRATPRDTSPRGAPAGWLDRLLARGR